MYQVSDAWKVDVVINNGQSLKASLEFVAKLGHGSINLSMQFSLFGIPLRSKLALGQLNSWL